MNLPRPAPQVTRKVLRSKPIHNSHEVKLYEWTDENGAKQYSVTIYDVHEEEDRKEEFHGFDYEEATADWKSRIRNARHEDPSVTV